MVAGHPDVRTRGYVDDFTQICTGLSAKQVAIRLARAAVQFVCVAALLHLTISVKSVIVASHALIVTEVVRRIKQFGVRINFEACARDLGVLFSIRRTRRIHILNTRLKDACVRLDGTRKLVKVAKKARRLAPSGALPAAIYGVECSGMAPSRVSWFRTQMASATGITQAGRCATTALRLAFGRDPAEEIVARSLFAWFRHFRAKGGVQAALRVAWRAACQRILVGGWQENPLSMDQPKVRWGRVTGPLSALIATLTGYGWRMMYLDLWMPPHSTSSWVLDPHGTSRAGGR